MKLQKLEMILGKIKEEMPRMDSDISKTMAAIGKLNGKLWKLKEKREKKIKICTVLSGLKETWKQGHLKDNKLNEPYYTFLIKKSGEFLPAFPKEWGDYSDFSPEIVIVSIEKLFLRKCPKCGKFSLLIRRCELVGVVTPKGDSEAVEEEFLIICCGEVQILGRIPGQSKVAPF